MSIIIVNYKTPDLTKRCIDSIYKTVSGDISFEIIVVDNCSEDDSETVVLSEFKDIRWFNNPKNEGFGRANNIGIDYSRGDYILFLNSDVLLTNDPVSRSLEVIRRNPNIGVLGVKLLNEDGTVQNFTSTVASYRKLLDANIVYNYFFKPSPYKISVVMGSFMLVPKKVLSKYGGFDPDFFMYSEEVELCNRISRNNYEIFYDESISVVHTNGGSTKDRTWANKQAYLSNALLFFKVRGYGGYLIYHFLMLSNVLINFCAMWFLDKEYRTGYWEEFNYYFSNFTSYFSLAFKYGRKAGSHLEPLKFIG